MAKKWKLIRVSDETFEALMRKKLSMEQTAMNSVSSDVKIEIPLCNVVGAMAMKPQFFYDDELPKLKRGKRK